MVNVASAQIKVGLDINKNLKEILKFIDKAKSKKSDIVCFPEACLNSSYKPIDVSKEIKTLISHADVPHDLANAIFDAYEEMGNDPYVAVRSSATSEDSASAAWAGQLDSFLNTSEKELLENVLMHRKLETLLRKLKI